MNKFCAVLLSTGLLLIMGCNRNVPGGSAPGSTNIIMSLKMLDGVVARQVHIQVGGKDVEATVFPKDLGQSALFLCYYHLPSPAEDKEASWVAINAEINRCVANVGGEIFSRKDFLAAEYPTAEVVAKSSKKQSHSIRCRVICTGKEIQSLTAITPDNQDAAHTQALDKMFYEFNAK